jgi:tetratricopeptide (TPR) repeat protein
MADPHPTADRAGPTPDAAARKSLLVRLVVGAAHWATASKLHMAIGGLGGLAVLASVFAAWSLIAHLAVESLQPVTVEMALEALDAGKYEDAKAIIGDMQPQLATPQLLGGAMFVLGVVKAHDAEIETSPERRSTNFQVAARYLQQAQTQGVPQGREAQAAFLLGKCLVNGGQPLAGVAALENALRLHAEPATEIHALLVRASMDAPDPDLEAALTHNDFVIRDPALTGERRDEVWLLRGETLLRMERPADAVEALAQVGGDGPLAGRRMVLLGRLLWDEAQRLSAESAERPAKIQAALEQFAAAQKWDVENGPLTREAIYWTARCHELTGDHDAALAQYNRLSNLYGDTNEGVAATLAEADHARLMGNHERALAAYRTVLQMIGNPQAYDNALLPLAELRTRLWTAYQQFVGEELFSEALAMLDLIEPVLGPVESTELRAKTHQQWGARRRDQAAPETEKQATALGAEGRFHLRAAGRAYEDLARMRFATRYFTRDLWAAADCYFQGQSFTHAARLLEEYLLHEARQWNSVALVRLGQARIARGEFQRAIDALEECIEMFPRDATAYQARLEAARAYKQLGNAAKDEDEREAKLEESEQLLRFNLGAEALTPASPEWRDSLFALGQLLYETDRYQEAVDVLDEAVHRYPDDGATLLGKYMIARAYHSGAQELAARLREPSGENESQINRNRKLIQEYLESAHATYLDVQQTITLAGSADDDPLTRTLLRNCYMMQGSVLLELRQFDEARQAYQNVITLYQNDPVVLESFIQVANCWRRLDQPALARANLERAKVVLGKLPEDADFLASTNFNRQQWRLLLDEMSKW